MRKKIPSNQIHALRGSLKRKPGEKPFAAQWAEYQRAEIELEEAKLCRISCLNKPRRKSAQPG